MRAAAIALIFSLSCSAQIAVNTIAGGGSEDGLAATGSHQYGLGALAPDGSIYFSSHFFIWKLTPDGILHVIAGTGVTTFNGDGPALSTNVSPASMALDSAGNLYFVDLSGRIRKLASGTISTIAGNGLPAGPITDGNALAVPIDYLSIIATDSAGNVIIAENNKARIRRITPDGQIALIAGAPQTNYADDGDGGPALQAHFSNILSIAYDPGGNLIVGEALFIRRISPSGIVTTIAGNPNQTAPLVSAGASATAVSFRYLSSSALDDTGAVYFNISTPSASGDSAAPGIYKIGPDGTLSLLYPNLAPTRFLFDAANTLYYVTGTQLHRLPSSGSDQLVSGGATYSSPDGTPALSAIISPFAVAADANGTVYFSDSGCRIRKIGTDGAIATFAGNGACATAATSGPAATTAMMPVSHLASSGPNLFFSAGSNTGWIDQSGNIQIAANVPRVPMAGDGAGGLYYAEGPNIMKFTPGSDPAVYARVPAQVGSLPLSSNPPAIAATSSGTVYVMGQQYNGIVTGAEIDSGGHISLFDFPLQTSSFCVNGPLAWFSTEVEGLYISAGGQFTQVGFNYAFAGDGGPVESAAFYSTADIACDGAGNVFVADRGNMRIRKLSGALLPVAPSIQPNGVVNSASYSSGLVDGELISIFGSNLSHANIAAPVTSNQFPSSAGNVQVLVNSRTATIIAAYPSQINAVVPFYSVYCGASSSISVVVTVDGVPSSNYSAPCAAAAPGLFTADQSGKGPGAIVNQDGTVNSAMNPAPRGSVISLYGTGAGDLDVTTYNGYLDLSPPYGNIKASVSASIGGEDAGVQYAGGAPFLVAGAFQINATIPGDIAPGLANVTVTIGGVASNTVQVWTR